jgi:hypothetical protein
MIEIGEQIGHLLRVEAPLLRQPGHFGETTFCEGNMLAGMNGGGRQSDLSRLRETFGRVKDVARHADRGGLNESGHPYDQHQKP